MKLVFGLKDISNIYIKYFKDISNNKNCQMSKCSMNNKIIFSTINFAECFFWSVSIYICFESRRNTYLCFFRFTEKLWKLSEATRERGTWPISSTWRTKTLLLQRPINGLTPKLELRRRMVESSNLQQRAAAAAATTTAVAIATTKQKISPSNCSSWSAEASQWVYFSNWILWNATRL